MSVDSPIEHAPHVEKSAPRGIGIVAFGATRALAPWDSGDWYFWVLNDAYVHYAKRASTIFEMHPPSHYNGLDEHGKPNYVDGHERRLEEIASRGGCDVILAFPNPKIPHGKLYPLDDVVAKFGRKYFCSTIAYMIPLAILTIEASLEANDGLFAPQIAVWGADMQLTSEYAKERACVEYWLGRAEERGIEIVVDDRSPLLKMGYLYGYETADIDRRVELIKGRQLEINNLLLEDDRLIQEREIIQAERRGMLSETAWFLSLFTTAPHAGEDHEASKRK